MKILILADDFPPRAVGGAGRVAEQVASGYLSRGHEVSVITTVRSKKDEGDYGHEGICVHTIHSDYAGRWVAYRSLYNPSTVSKIGAYIKKYKPDVVHAHNIHYHISYYVLKLAKKSGAKVLLTAHDCMLFHYGKFDEYIDPNNLSVPKRFNYKISPWRQVAVYRKRYNPLRNIVIRHYVKYCDKICAVSNALEQALNANGINNTVVVHNGIDVKQWDKWLKGAEDFRTANNLGQRPIVGFVGKLTGAKGGAQLLRVFKEIKARIPEALLLVIGAEDSLVFNAKTLAEEFGIASSIIVTGRLAGAELASAYRACDVIAFPSLCLDTFGMVNVEAMLTGKPVVATCFGGAPEVVVGGVTGAIVNPYDTTSMSEAMLTFLNDPKTARLFGEKGRERVEGRFTLDRQVDAYLALMWQ